ncbi:MAG TPA: hypothetical protein VES39_11720 [Rhodospirillales bacterium]|nr:hypothetical protein [Rhodospirillales bacterium]
MAVRIEKDGPVWTVVHDRLEARNALDPESADALTSDGVAGAARFRDGLGRHRDFNKIDWPGSAADASAPFVCGADLVLPGRHCRQTYRQGGTAGEGGLR